MPRPLIYQRPDTWELFEVTCRTIHSRFLLSPGEEAGRRVLGVIGKALQHYGKDVILHLLAGTSNHLHFLLSTRTSDARADFKCFVMTNLSKEIGDLHDWPQAMWGRRSKEIVVVDEEASRDRAVYLAAHGRKEGLLRENEAWPGLPWLRAVTEGRPLVGTWYDRTRLGELLRAWRRQDPNKRGRKPNLNDVAERIRVPLHPMPYMAEWSQDEQQAEWKRLVQIGHERYPTPENPLGVEQLLGQNPHTRPKETKKSTAPFAHYRDRGALQEWQDDYKAFQYAYYAHTDQIAELVQDKQSDWAYPPGGVTPIQLPRIRREHCPTDRPREPDRTAA